jgi:hypothetical protein
LYIDGLRLALILAFKMAMALENQAVLRIIQASDHKGVLEINLNDNGLGNSGKEL